MINEIIERPWGSYIVLYEDDKCKVKKIIVNPGKRLSLQSHKKRQEVWTITSGKGRITKKINTFNHCHVSKIQPCDKDLQWEPMLKNYDVYNEVNVLIFKGELHRIENIGEDLLEFIEIQTGEYFGEDDIIRYEDDFGRV